MRTSRKYTHKRGSLVYDTEYGRIVIYRVISSERITKASYFYFVEVKPLLVANIINSDIEKLIIEHLKIVNNDSKFVYIKSLKK